MENLAQNEEFQQVTPVLPGITVFAPKRKPEEEQKAQGYTCPQCGGHLAYNLVTSGLACQFCGYQATVRARTIGPVAEKHEFTTDTMALVDFGASLFTNRFDLWRSYHIFPGDFGVVTAFTGVTLEQ